MQRIVELTTMRLQNARDFDAENAAEHKKAVIRMG
jgi:hypothetical protein